MKKITVMISLVVTLILVFFIIYYYQTSIVKPYTPPVSDNSVTMLRNILPHKDASFEISWNDTTNQAEAIIYPPYADSANDLVDWLANNQANNLPKNTVKILRK